MHLYMPRNSLRFSRMAHISDVMDPWVESQLAKSRRRLETMVARKRLSGVAALLATTVERRCGYLAPDD